LLVAAIAVSPMPLAAQFPTIDFPDASPRATVSQVVGFTSVSVDYGRPAVKGRKIWGGQVPYDSVWRAGANVNTILAVSSPFTIAGKALPAGKYGLHMIPTAGSWTVALSKEANAWGSFSYSASEDATRFTVTPKEASMTERLQYTMEDVTDSTVAVTLRWEKLSVALPIAIDASKLALDSIAQQLRSIPYFFPESWLAAGRWALTNSTRYDLAEAWADSSIKRQQNFGNTRLKAAARERQGDKAGADKLRQQAFAFATEADVNLLAYGLMNAGNVDSAMVLFQKNVKDYPRSWNVYDSLAEGYAKKGDKAKAVAMYQKAKGMTEDETQRKRIDMALAGLR
jgi:tetratricopeptide (TPR) repeat protein